jgi:hypothetical protein
MTTFDLAPYISGDTWKGIPSITIFREGSALDLTDAHAEMHVKFQIDAPSVTTFSSASGSLLILDPPTDGVLQIPPQIVNIPPANYIYSIKVTLGNGEVDTFVYGHWNVIKTA